MQATRRDESGLRPAHAPGADQFLLRTRGAVSQALAFAKREQMRAWLTDEGYDFVLLGTFCPPPTHASAREQQDYR